MDEPDVLVQEPRAPKHPRLVRLLAVALVLAALLGATGAWAAERSRATEEAAALDRCVANAEAAVRLAENKLGAMVRYVVPALGTISLELDDNLYRLIQARAVGLDRPVTEALDRCRAVELWPVSLERREARAAYVAFLEAEVARLLAIADDGRFYYREYDRVRRLRQEAEDALARV